MRDDMSQVGSYLKQQKIDAGLIYDVQAFRERYETEAEVQERIVMPDMLYYGKEILEMSIAALLQEENLLLSGYFFSCKYGQCSFNRNRHLCRQ